LLARRIEAAVGPQRETLQTILISSPRRAAPNQRLLTGRRRLGYILPIKISYTWIFL